MLKYLYLIQLEFCVKVFKVFSFWNRNNFTRHKKKKKKEKETGYSLLFRKKANTHTIFEAYARMRK